MKLNYNVTGSERKSLVGAISAALNTPTKYLGAPTFIYEIGSYHIDKAGTITGPDNLDLEDLLHQAGFDAEGDSREYDEDDTYESGLGGMGAFDEIPDIDQHHPGQYAKPDVSSKRGFEAEIEAVTDALCIELPLKDTTQAAIENLRRMIGSKATLIKKALGTNSLEIELTEDRIRFPWFDRIPEPEVINAAAHLIGKLLTAAKSQKRVIASEKETDNEKYAFRCFLLRLGFIGEEFKETRRTLLQNLTGSAAFRSGAKKDSSDEDLDTEVVEETEKALLTGEEATDDEISE